MSGKSSRFASQWSAYAKRKPQYHIHTIQPYPTLLPAMCVCGVSVCSCMYACTGTCMHACKHRTAPAPFVLTWIFKGGSKDPANPTSYRPILENL